MTKPTRRQLLRSATGAGMAALWAARTPLPVLARPQSDGDKNEKDGGKNGDASRAWRVVEAATGKTLKWNELAGRLAENDVIFVGEQHDDAATHQIEAALLEAVHKKVGARLTLSLEMFERDGQVVLDDYLAGRSDEAALAKSVKLWPNYMTDYRPLVEYAKENRLPVVAANAPARLVRNVSRDGLAKAVAALAPPDRALVAAYITAPQGDEYQTRFAAVIGEGHKEGDSKDGLSPDAIQRFYEAQCVRDDTMAESIARVADQKRVVVHVCGAFHSDAGLGTVARLRWRRPIGTRVAVVKIAPVADVAKADPASLAREADFVIFAPGKTNE